MNQNSDQITTLRNTASEALLDLRSPIVDREVPVAIPLTSDMLRTRSIAITSGKGGVGKSNFAVNVALELGSRGKRVYLIDGDLALANADVLLGVTPAHHLGHVLSGT